MRIGKGLYLDHQATTPIDPQVFSAMEPYLKEEFGNPHSSEHAFGWSANAAIEKAAGDVACLLGADGDEIVFTSGATESNNLALCGLAANPGLRRRILIGRIDHKSSLAVGRVLAEKGFDVHHVCVDRHGAIDEDHLRELFDRPVLLASFCLVNSEIGTIQDAKVISDIVRSKGALVHWDAAQAPCAIDTRELSQHADLVSLSGHKIYGPKGIGALFVGRNSRHRLRPIIHGGGQQSNLRSGTLPTALCVGFGTAAKLLLGNASAVERARVGTIRDYFWRGLQGLGQGAILNGPPLIVRHPGNLNVQLPIVSGRDLLGALQPKLAASTGSACASGIEEPSHVLTGIGLTSYEAESSIRLCVGRYTTEADVEAALQCIREAINRLTESTLSKVV